MQEHWHALLRDRQRRHLRRSGEAVTPTGRSRPLLAAIAGAAPSRLPRRIGGGVKGSVQTGNMGNRFDVTAGGGRWFPLPLQGKGLGVRSPMRARIKVPITRRQRVAVEKIQFAKGLRRNMTFEERLLWTRLRRSALQGISQTASNLWIYRRLLLRQLPTWRSSWMGQSTTGRSRRIVPAIRRRLKWASERCGLGMRSWRRISRVW